MMPAVLKIFVSTLLLITAASAGAVSRRRRESAWLALADLKAWESEGGHPEG